MGYSKSYLKYFHLKNLRQEYKTRDGHKVRVSNQQKQYTIYEYILRVKGALPVHMRIASPHHYNVLVHEARHFASLQLCD